MLNIEPNAFFPIAFFSGGFPEKYRLGLCAFLCVALTSEVRTERLFLSDDSSMSQGIKSEVPSDFHSAALLQH